METLFAYINWVYFLSFSFLLFIFVLQKGFHARLSRSIIFSCIISFMLLGIFAFFSADWPSYKEGVVQQYVTNGKAASQLESFWRWVSLTVKGNIYLFRSFIYIPCYIILFLYLIFFVPKKERFLVFFLYVIFMLYRVGGTRQGLSVILFYFAFMLLRGHFLRKIVALGLMVFCLFLHKGSILFYPVLFLSGINLSKRMIIVSLTLTAAAFVWFYFYFEGFIQRFFPEFIFIYYLGEEDSSTWSRRLVYMNKIMDIANLFFVLIVLAKSFRCNLSTTGKRYRNFLYYGFLLFFIIRYTGLFNYSMANRYLGLMLWLPVIFLASEILVKKRARSFLFTTFFWAYIALFFINTNIQISGFVGVGKGLF